MKRRFISLSIGVALAAVAGVSASTPAMALTCTNNHGQYTGSDYAWHSTSNSACLTVWVRHRYNPVWSGNDYWTSWYSNAGTYVRSQSTAELYQHQIGLG